MTAPPRVSVIIPVFNRERYVATAIESILGQRFADFELILIDDGSTDASRAVMASYRDPRVRLVENGRNLGIPATRNLGLSLARGEYVAWLDSDDRAYPDRLGRQVAFLDRNPDVALVGGFARAMDESGRAQRKVKRLPTSPEEVRARLLFRCCILQYAVMGRTAVLARHGYREDFPVCQDVDLFVRLAETERLANLPEVLVCRRLHADRTTLTRSAQVEAKNKEIAAGQLAALGVAFSEADLENHFVLPRLGKLRLRPDATYLDWTEGWLQRLEAANRRTGRYPRAAFERVLGRIWLRTCARAADRDAWLRLARSPLRRLALAGLGSAVMTDVFRPGRWSLRPGSPARG